MAGEDLPGAIRRALRIELTPTAFSRRVARFTEDVSAALLCALRNAVQTSGRGSAFSALQEEVADLEVALREYLSDDMAQAAAEVFRVVERPSGAKLHAPITLADDPPRMAIAETFQQIGEDLQSTFYRGDVEYVQRQIAALAAGGVRLASSLRGPLLNPIARGMHAAELDILPRVLVPTFVIETQRFLDAARDEFAWWFRLVRTCLAVALLDGLPYAEVWGNHYKTACRKVPVADRGIYGEAGYWLAMAVIELAGDVEQSPAYQRLIADASGDTWLAEFASFSPSLAGPSLYPLVRTRNQLPFDAARWRARCTLMPCRIDEQGEQFPFEFPPVANEVINNPELVGEQDHMYARTNAQRLIRFVRAQWDRYRTDVLPEMEIVVSAKDKNARHRDLEFRVGAATLRHGGAHPPHKTHRNGAMFDVAVRGILPLHCKGQPEISGEEETAREAEWAGLSPSRRPPTRTVPFRLEGPPAPQPAQPQQAPSLFTQGPSAAADDPAEEVRSPCRQWDYPARTIKWKGGTIPIEKVGMRITQCILLSFPSQVILQDWRTLRDATNDLIDRFEKLEASAAEDADKSAIRHILQWLGKREPEEEPPPPGRGRLLPGVPKHHDHWHVSYPPADVEAPPDGREAALLWIEAHLPEILPD